MESLKPVEAWRRLKAPESVWNREAPGPWRPPKNPAGPGGPGGPPAARLKKYYRFKKTVIKLVFHFQFKYINGLKAVKILVDARKRRV